jgi:hypothetical protein
VPRGSEGVCASRAVLWERCSCLPRGRVDPIGATIVASVPEIRYTDSVTGEVWTTTTRRSWTSGEAAWGSASVSASAMAAVTTTGSGSAAGSASVWG